MTPAQHTAIEQTEKVRNRLAFFLVLSFVAVLPLLFWVTIPGDNKEILVYMIGQLSGMATTVLGFYFVNKVGQDASDARRTENTSKALDAIKTVAENAGPAPAAPDVTLQPGETAQAADPPSEETR